MDADCPRVEFPAIKEIFLKCKIALGWQKDTIPSNKAWITLTALCVDSGGSTFEGRGLSAINIKHRLTCIEVLTTQVYRGKGLENHITNFTTLYFIYNGLYLTKALGFSTPFLKCVLISIPQYRLR